MNESILTYLRTITAEEQAILDGNNIIQRDIYTSRQEFIVDNAKLLQRGQLIEIRPHTRFTYFPAHRHNYIEMVYMCSGSTTHIINGQERIVLHEGDLIFFSQSISHEILPAGLDDLAVNFIILPEFFRQGFSEAERENVLQDFLVATLFDRSEEGRYLHFRAKHILPIENILENMIWTLIYQKHGTNTLNRASMSLLFLNLSRFAERINEAAPNQTEQNQVFAVLKYIETNYQTGTLAEISQRVGLPTYTVSRMLKKHTADSFKGLLQTRRLQQAAYLLEHTPQTTESILEAIGYDNSSYFHHKFRERYGCSPKEYRTAKRQQI